MGKKRGKKDERDAADMTPEEREQMVSEVMGEAMARLHERLAAMLENLDGLNSSFEMTQEFLQARGLTKVSQLDAEGKQELRRYLEQKLKEILAEKGMGRKPRGPSN